MAVNGEDAVRLLPGSSPDLILLDLLMPKKDGFYVLEEMKKNSQWALIPVIVLSNFSRDEEITRAMGMGAKDYLIKSQNSIDQVIERIRGYL